jgi:hypothetical protein
LKISSLSPPAAAIALLAVAVFAAATVAQAPQGPPPEGHPQPPRTYPAPTNLKVLPKTLTGQQVHDIMEKWAGSLGVHCDTCHTSDPNNIGPNGRPRLKFEDDSKQEKLTARLMVKMTEDINDNYVSMIPEDKDHDKDEAEHHHGLPVTCGTCHRGHQHPEEYIIPRDDGPRRPEGAPPTGAMPPMPK